MWHMKQVSFTLSRTSCFGLPPCTLWHEEHDIVPSSTGWWTGRCICTRVSLWQAKQVSLCSARSRTGSRAACTWWQEEHDTSVRACALICQSMREAPWWQVMQTCVRASIGVFACFENSTSGFGRAPAPAPDLCAMCAVLSPWQLVHEGVRLSAMVPCLVAPMASTGKVSFSSWQRVHFASPRSTRSLSCATALAASNARRIVSRYFIGRPYLFRSRPVGLLVRETEMAVDAGRAFGLCLGVTRARGLALLLRVHGRDGV